MIPRPVRPVAWFSIGLLVAATALPALADVLPPNYRLEPVLTGLTDPHGIALLPDGRMLVLERTTGQVRVVQSGRLLPAPFATVAVPASSAEGGLLGIAAHPDFAANRWVFLYYTKASNGKNRVERWTAFGNTAGNPFVILDDIGPTVVGLGEDNGGGLAFGADGALYVGVGVMENDGAAQDDGSYLGKVLRIAFNADGSVAGVAAHAKGFRDVAGLAAGGGGTIYAVDHYDADDTCDEVNVVQSGANYGWSTASCGDGNQQAPLQIMTPQQDLCSVASYGGSRYPTPKVCANDPTRSCTFHAFCSNDPTVPCWTDRVCSNDASQACTHTRVCSDNPTVICTQDADCSPATCIWPCGTGNGCVEACGSGATCVPSCGWGVACVDQATRPLFVAGEISGKIYRDVLSGAAWDTLSSSGLFYDPATDPEAGGCPDTIVDLDEGADGWLYVTSDDPDPGKAGIYRAIWDDYGASGKAKPREVSASRHLPLMVEKDAVSGGVKILWEDLRSDAWGCSPGHCPAGSHASRYTVWSGPLQSPFAYTHTVLVETSGARMNDALLSHTQTPMPTDSRYYLVSARAANLEGSLGKSSSGVERPGWAQEDLCAAIGYGSNSSDLDKCSQDWAVGYPDQDNHLWKLSDFRGKAVMLSFHQYG